MAEDQATLDFVVTTNEPAPQVVAGTPAGEPEQTVEPKPAPETAGEPEAVEKPDDASEAGKTLQVRKRSLEGRKQTIQEQINELVRQRGETAKERAAILEETQRLRAERDTLQKEIQQGKTGKTGETSRATVNGDDPEPDESQFDDYSAFVRAQAKWAAREAVRIDRREATAAQEQQSRGQWEAERQKGFAERYRTFAAANPEFEAEVNRDDLGLTAPVVDVIKDSPVGPQLMLFLARHPEEVERLASLHPVIAYGEMKKHEARAEAAHSGSVPAAAKTVSTARPPIKPVEGTSRGEDGDVSDDWSVDEHIRRMNARDRAAARR